jgi:hypothetical protein
LGVPTISNKNRGLEDSFRILDDSGLILNNNNNNNNSSGNQKEDIF